MDIPANGTDIKALRKKQLIMINAIQLPGLLALFFAAFVLDLTIGTLLFAAVFFGIAKGALLLWQSKTTRRLIPVFEQAAVYEKEVLGDEYRKNKTLESLMMFLVSTVMLMQFTTLDFLDRPFLTDLPIALGILLLLALGLNINEIFHFSKIDSPKEEGDHANFTRNRLYFSLKIALLIMVLIVVVSTLIFFTIFYSIPPESRSSLHQIGGFYE